MVEQKKVMTESKDFVRAVMEYKNPKDIAEALGIQESSVKMRVTKYRKMGVKLPKLSRKHRMAPVQELNEIIKSYRG